MHLLTSLAAHGWHPAAWRMKDEAGFAATAPFRTMARAAERGGLDAVLLGLPIAPMALRAGGSVDGIRLDPLPLLGAMIGATEQIGLCAWWPGDIAEPFHVARVFATLDHLCFRADWLDHRTRGARGAGRPVPLRQRAPIGGGVRGAAGRVDRRCSPALGQLGRSRLRRDQATGTFADPVHVHPIEHAGKFFTVRGPLNVPRPVQGQPVLLHRDVPPGAQRAGAAASAEVVLAECTTAAEAAASREDWRALAQSHGRDPDGLRFVVRVMAILAGSEKAARTRAAELDGLAGGSGTRAVRFTGTPDQFANWLAQWHSAGACDGFDILPAVLPVDLDTIVEAVVPQLRRRGLRPAGYEHATLRGHFGLRRSASRFAA
jgi:alkanesulfonate monooxygenase SsuD/methylene tetrahydromethanopterin reductase-like flavin-dependent oxidoreductase (luciferase family)